MKIRLKLIFNNYRMSILSHIHLISFIELSHAKLYDEIHIIKQQFVGFCWSHYQRVIFTPSYTPEFNQIYLVLTLVDTMNDTMMTQETFVDEQKTYLFFTKQTLINFPYFSLSLSQNLNM